MQLSISMLLVLLRNAKSNCADGRRHRNQYPDYISQVNEFDHVARLFWHLRR